MRRSIRALALAAGALLSAAAPAAAARTCDPFTQAEFRGKVPSSQQVIGIGLGDRDVTTAESDRYLLAVDAASNRVTSGVAATSNQGRPLRYAIVGEPGTVTPKGLDKVRAAAATLMDPRTSDREAAKIARKDPAILWVAGNVHGGEESGTDASLRVLYELADREDCAAEQILENSLVVILPTQNPDGREADTRRNAYGFDMNRDWFARTQPETDGKLELLRRYPGVMFIDAHEMGTEGFFFPPNADPIYHEITDQAVDWINNVYGRSMQDEFGERNIPFFNYDIYDLFYMGYGDTVPSTGFGAAGMTYEKASGDPTPRRVFEQYLTQWTSLSAGALRKREILERLARRLGRGGAAGPRRRAGAERGRPAEQHGPAAGAGHQGAPLLRARRRARQGARGAGARAAAAPDGRRRPAAQRAAHRPRLQALRARAPLGDAARRDVLDADGAAPEALGPGDAARGSLHAVPVLLRHDGVEPGDAVQPRRRLLRPRAVAAGRARGSGRRPRPARTARVAAGDRDLPDLPDQLDEHRVLGLAALAAGPVGAAPPHRVRGGHRGRRRCRGPAC